MNNKEIEKLLSTQTVQREFLMKAAKIQSFYIGHKDDDEICPYSDGFNFEGHSCVVEVPYIRMNKTRRWSGTGYEPFERWKLPTKKDMLDQIKSMTFNIRIDENCEDEEVNLSVNFSELPHGCKKVWTEKLLSMFKKFEGIEA